MKYFFAAVIILHGAIHLLGFAKGFSLAQVHGLQADVSRSAGLFWFAAFLLFSVTATGYLSGNKNWPLVAIPAIIISAALILSTWSDARFGMIPNVLILLAATISISSEGMNRMIAGETSHILLAGQGSDYEIITEEHIAGLPAPVYNWLRSSGITGRAEIKSAWVKQKALMKMKPGQRKWYGAEAEQIVTTYNPAFIWTVNLKMMPFIEIKGRDKFVDGKGEMLIKLNSLVNIVNEKGDKMNEGTLQRYLGEIVWFPSMALSPYIKWEGIDDFSAKATMNYKGTSGSGTFFFDEQGDFLKFSTMRYMGNDQDAKRYEWVITVEDYAVYEGIRVPAKMEAAWTLEDGPWTWLKLEITDLMYNKEY